MVTALLGLFLLQADPRAIIREGTHAVEADSAPSARARWENALRSNPVDRPSLLALATLERLTYKYDDANRHYHSLIGATPPDIYSVYARIGRAEAMRRNR